MAHGPPRFGIKVNAVHKKLTPEVIEKFQQYTRLNSDGEPIGDLYQAFTMPDSAYLALIGDSRIRERKPGDAGGLLSHEPEMKELIRIDLAEGHVTAAWHIDKRISLVAGMPLNRILTMPPNKWNWPQARQIPDPLASVNIPI